MFSPLGFDTYYHIYIFFLVLYIKLFRNRVFDFWAPHDNLQYIRLDICVSFVTPFNTFRQHWIFQTTLPHTNKSHIFTILGTFSLFWLHFSTFEHHCDILRYLWHVRHSCSHFHTFWHIIHLQTTIHTPQIIHFRCSVCCPLLCLCPL